MANNVDPDEKARYEPSHLDLHNLHRNLYWSVALKELSPIIDISAHNRYFCCAFRYGSSFAVLFCFIVCRLLQLCRFILSLCLTLSVGGSGKVCFAIVAFPFYFRHRGVQLILAYSWARPAILVAGKGRWGIFLFLLFLHFHSCSFLPCPSL